jgi:hypothetical protein
LGSFGGKCLAELAKKLSQLGLKGPRQQRTRALTQNFGEWIDECPWLNQFEDTIVGHGVSLLRWRSGRR